MITAYFDSIRQTLILDELIESFKVIREMSGNNDGFSGQNAAFQTAQSLSLRNTPRLYQAGFHGKHTAITGRLAKGCFSKDGTMRHTTLKSLHFPIIFIRVT